MPQLIIDEHALRILMERLPGQAIFAQPDGSFLSPGVVDIVEGNETENPWKPANDLARGIVLGGEACKEIVFQAERFKEGHRRARTAKAMSVPVCSLMDVLKALMAAFNKPPWQSARKAWPIHDQEGYIDIGRRLRKSHMDGPVRKVRHTLGAHLDLGAAGGGVRLSMDDLLSALGDSLIILMLMLNHPRAFSWIRGVGVLADGTGRVVDTMDEYPLAVRWLTDMDGHVLDVGDLRLADDPLHAIWPHIMEAVETYNTMVRATSSSLRTISCVPTEDLHKDTALARSLSTKSRP